MFFLFGTSSPTLISLACVRVLRGEHDFPGAGWQIAPAHRALPECVWGGQLLPAGASALPALRVMVL